MAVQQRTPFTSATATVGLGHERPAKVRPAIGSSIPKSRPSSGTGRRHDTTKGYETSATGAMGTHDSFAASAARPHPTPPRGFPTSGIVLPWWAAGLAVSLTSADGWHLKGQRQDVPRDPGRAFLYG